MKLKLCAAAAFISVTAFVSCAGNKDKDYVDKTLISPATENTTVQPVEANTATTQAITQTTNTVPNTTAGTTTIIPGTQTINPAQQTKAININPQQNVVTPGQVTTTTPQQTQQTTAPGMNPPHGEPGHRCDITVGAPLNSKPLPANTPPTTVTTQQAPVAINTQQTQQVTAPGMNPPHGQPNHRCDISVGAPLNSPPGPSATPQTITMPVKRDSAKN